jgi:hypothetical protein
LFLFLGFSSSREFKSAYDCSFITSVQRQEQDRNYQERRIRI